MSTKKKYYGNHECMVLFENDTDALIEIFVDSACIDGGNGFDEPPEFEPVYTQIVVPRAMIRDFKIEVDAATIEAHKIIEAAESKAEEITRAAEYEKLSILREAKSEGDGIRKRVEKYESHGLIEYLNFLDGTYEWFVMLDSYRVGIHNIEDFKDDDRRNYKEIKAISFRANAQLKKNTGHLYVSQYSDDSGSCYKIKGFRTLKDAEAFLVHQVESGAVEPRALEGKSNSKYPITCPKIEDYKATLEASADERRLKEIADMRAKLAKLESPTAATDDDECPALPF